MNIQINQATLDKQSIEIIFTCLVVNKMFGFPKGNNEEDLSLTYDTHL